VTKYEIESKYFWEEYNDDIKDQLEEFEDRQLDDAFKELVSSSTEILKGLNKFYWHHKNDIRYNFESPSKSFWKFSYTKDFKHDEKYYHYNNQTGVFQKRLKKI